MKKLFLFSALILLNLSVLFALQPANPADDLNATKNASVSPSENYPAINSSTPPNGVDNPENEKSLSIAPNPATDHIDVQLNSNTSLLKELVLFDITGKLIKTISNSITQEKNKFTMMRDNLPGGVYFLMIKTSSEEFCRKIIFN